MKKLLKKQGFAPSRIVTDKLRFYPSAFRADALDVRVARPDILETTALGAAGLAGLATGVWQSADDFAASREYQWFAPSAASGQGYAGWRRAVASALHWARGA